MPRTPRRDSCMLCETFPCECNTRAKGPKKSLPSRPPVVSTAPVVTPRSDTPKSPVEPQPPSDDALLCMAVRNLAPLLHPDEVRKYRVLITSTPNATERAIAWRLAHGRG